MQFALQLNVCSKCATIRQQPPLVARNFQLTGGGNLSSKFLNPLIEISLDGGTYRTVLQADINSTVYSPTFQLKIRATVNSQITITDSLTVFNIGLNRYLNTDPLMSKAGSLLKAKGTISAGSLTMAAGLFSAIHTTDPATGAINSVVDISGVDIFAASGSTLPDLRGPWSATVDPTIVDDGFVTELIINF